LPFKWKPAEETYKILKHVISKGETTREDIKESTQLPELDIYLEFLVKNDFISERRGVKQYFYTLTIKGEKLYSTLIRDQLFKNVLRIGKK